MAETNQLHLENTVENSLDPSVNTFKVLITGFGPFKKHPINASWEAVSLLPDTIPNTNIEIVKIQIEVSYDHIDNIVPQLWKKYNPDLVIHVGVSELAKKITVETCGHRDKYKKEDIYGKIPCHLKCKAAELCVETGDSSIAQRKSCLDLGRLIQKFQNEKESLNSTFDVDISEVDIVLSTDAGRYLCEYVYFTSLCIDCTRCVFVHVPMINVPYSLKELADSLFSIIILLSQELFSK